MNKLKYFLLILILILIYGGCSEEDDLGPPDEEFMGTYMVRDLGVVQASAKIDSVIFSIINGPSTDSSEYSVLLILVKAVEKISPSSRGVAVGVAVAVPVGVGVADGFSTR